MYSRFTSEGRTVCRGIAKTVGFAVIIVTVGGMLTLAGQAAAPAVASWWRHLSTPAPAPAMATTPEAFPSSTTMRPQSAPLRQDVYVRRESAPNPPIGFPPKAGYRVGGNWRPFPTPRSSHRDNDRDAARDRRDAERKAIEARKKHEAQLARERAEAAAKAKAKARQKEQPQKGKKRPGRK